MPSNPPIAGSDGKVPIYDPSGRWCIWSLQEIYLGTIGNNKYVPKINDFVIDYTTFTTYRVDALDEVTLIPTMHEIRPANMSFSMVETDVLFGVGPGTQSDTYRAYLDTSVTPYVLDIDGRLKVAGTLTSYAKVFLGSDLGANSKVISKIYDSNGNFVSENVPLELVAIDNHTNYTIRRASVCNVTELLNDGEVITAVFYAADGHVVSKRQLLVENTTFIRSLNSSQKYITQISADCAFMSANDDTTIDFPLNIPINALNLMGTVHYSDGSTLKLPVDGNKFKMLGLDTYMSTIIGQNIPLVLSYQLSPGELSYAGVGVEAKMVTRPYAIKTVNPNNSYTVKLYGYPYWVDAENGYTMRWWLVNLDRDICLDVTPYVVFDQSTGAFNPKGYGYLQHKSVSINLRNVSGAFKAFVHVQHVDIVLNAPTVDNTAWTMTQVSDESSLAYGQGIHATKVDNASFTLASGFTTFNNWKTNVYNRTYPIVNAINELTAPEPTHFIVGYNGFEAEYPMTSWDATLVMNSPVTLYRTVSIKFIKRTSTGDLKLSVATMIIKP